jgi:hypothetical protein
MIYSFQSSIYQYLLFTSILIGYSIGKYQGHVICRFAEQNKTEYWPGELISGTFKFVNFTYEKLKVKRIDVELIGELIYYANKNSSRSVTIFRDQRSLLQSNGDPKKFLLVNGDHSWSFSFRLKDSLPPTVRQTGVHRPYIYYYIRSLFVRPEWYRFNIDNKWPIVVNRSSSPGNVKQLEAEKNHKDVHLRLILQKNIIVDGDYLSLDVNMQNPKQKLIRRISVKLLQIWHLYPEKDDEISLVDEDLKGIRRFRGQHFKKNFLIHVPLKTPATFVFNRPSGSYIEKVVVSYELHVQAHIRGFFTNIRLQLPVIIANINPKKTMKTLWPFTNRSSTSN